MLVKYLTNIKYTNYPKVKLIYSEKEVNKFLNEDEYKKLILCKNKIDDIKNTKDWDKAKKLCNDYELIYTPNKNNKSNSISIYEPISRSYFKLWEIITYFKLLDNNQKLRCAGIAEGPGGFIECIVNYRNKYFSIKDDIYAITLIDDNKDIPSWKKSYKFLRNNNINICYGLDGTGNIYNVDNIKTFSEFVEDKIDFITADGGFDFSKNFNNQERLSTRIIFCEIVTALSIQKEGGTFICKLFDSYNDITIQYINLLNFLYEEIILVKPDTSRPANSEKYIICRGFKGIDQNYLKKLYIIVKSWENINNNNYIINNIFDEIIDKELLKDIVDFNTTTFNLQKNNISKTLNIINESQNLKKLNNIIKYQTQKAIDWCNRYNINVNYNSVFI